jgi:hypothetical protein
VTNGRGATPLPITFLGLTIATTLYAGFETRILPDVDFHTVGWLVLAIPVPMQFLPAVWGLIRGELAAATASSVLGATWLGLAIAGGVRGRVLPRAEERPQPDLTAPLSGFSRV